MAEQGTAAADDSELLEEYEVIVLGLGPGGEEVAERLAEAGRRVLGIEAHLTGGECPYYGCIPSKMIVRAAGTLAEAGRIEQLAGTATVEPDYRKPARRIRDEATDDWNDQVAVDRLRKLGGHFVRGFGRLAGRDAQGRPRVALGDRTFVADRLVIATGTAPVLPPISGLAELAGDQLSPDGPVWTNREVLQIRQAPESLVVIGGGAVGCELAQGLARFGVRVTQLETGRADPGARGAGGRRGGQPGLRTRGHRAAHRRADRTGRPDAAGVRVELADGRSFSAERLLVAAGRRGHLPELALDSVGLDPQAKTLQVDEHMQVADRIYAVGDVTGRGLFTHVAVWQARVLIAHLLDRPEPYGGYHGLAWVTFTDPEVGRVGMSEQQARDAGIEVAVGKSDIAANTRGWIHGPGNDGFVKLVADRSAGVLVGATVVSPAGGEILGTAHPGRARPGAAGDAADHALCLSDAAPRGFRGAAGDASNAGSLLGSLRRLGQAGGDPAAQFPGHPPLLERAHPGHQPDGQAVLGQALHPEHLRLGQKVPLPPVVGVDVTGRRPDRGLGRGQVVGTGHRHVEHHLRVPLGGVADPHDLAVADVPNHPFDVAQPGGAQPDRLHRAGRLADVDHVADAVLVLQHQEHPGQEVLDQVLRAEADRHPDQ